MQPQGVGSCKNSSGKLRKTFCLWEKKMVRSFCSISGMLRKSVAFWCEKKTSVYVKLKSVCMVENHEIKYSHFLKESIPLKFSFKKKFTFEAFFVLFYFCIFVAVYSSPDAPEVYELLIFSSGVNTKSTSGEKISKKMASFTLIENNIEIHLGHLVNAPENNFRKKTCKFVYFMKMTFKSI